MSTRSPHKMYDYEVVPPQGTWDKIAAELDESALTQKFPSTLFHSAVVPPAHAWQNIANALDEPALIVDYSHKLGSLEFAPPPSAWNKIKSALDPESGHARVIPFIRYAAAAVIIGLLAWGGVTLFSGGKETRLAGTDKSTSAELNKAPVNEQVPVADSDIAIADMNAALEEARNDEALEESKKTFAKLDTRTTQKKAKIAANYFFIADDFDYTTTGTSRGIPEYSEPEEFIVPRADLADRYIVLMTPDGNIIRMSKKLSNLVCCVSGEEADKDCMDQLKKWREKMASPSSVNSSSDFLGFLHMLNSLQDQ